MYLVHQIIVCILYTVLFPLSLAIRGTVSIPHTEQESCLLLAPALDHNDVITMGCFDKR